MSNPPFPTIYANASYNPPAVSGSAGLNGAIVFLLNAAPGPGDLEDPDWLDLHLIGSDEVVNGKWKVVLDTPLSNGLTTLYAVTFDVNEGEYSDVASADVSYQPGGTDGNDTLFGTPDSDTLDGGLGNDTISGGDGNDIISGGDGIDTLNGNDGHDRLDGGAGVDTLDGGDGNDVLEGGAGDDQLIGGDGADRLYGNDGNDSLVGGADNDLILGGNGNDNISGGDGVDHLEGGANDDTMSGGAENDHLEGGSGNDSLDGGTERDHMAGGTGDDTYFVDHVDDNVLEAAGQGTDTIRSEVSIRALAHNVENLRLGGTAYLGDGNNLNNRIEGNAFVNKLMGRDGNDSLFGFGGADTLIGGTGNDVLIGGADNDILTGGTGNDIFRFGSGDGADIITDFKKGQDKIDLDGFPPLTQVVIGSTALPNDPTVFYQKSTGRIWYDADGDFGAGAKVLLVTLLTRPDLGASDFI